MIASLAPPLRADVPATGGGGGEDDFIKEKPATDKHAHDVVAPDECVAVFGAQLSVYISAKESEHERAHVERGGVTTHSSVCSIARWK